MGNSSSKTSKANRIERTELRNAKISDNINNIKNYEKQIIKSGRDSSGRDSSGRASSATDIVNYDEIKTYLDITSIATEQLMRDGKPFTKKDLIAIFTALNDSQIANIKMLDSLTVTDLNCMIRCIVYDPNRYSSSGSHSGSRSGSHSGSQRDMQISGANTNIQRDHQYSSNATDQILNSSTYSKKGINKQLAIMDSNKINSSQLIISNGSRI